MTLQEWQSNPKLSEELAKVLKLPVLTTAIEIITGMTMANTLSRNQLLNVAQNGQTLFGYDVGRGDFLKDLQALSVPIEEVEQPEPDYIGEQTFKKESKDDIVRMHPKVKKIKKTV